MGREATKTYAKAENHNGVVWEGRRERGEPHFS